MGKQLIIAKNLSLSRAIQSALIYEKWEEYQGYSESEDFICTDCFENLFKLYDLDDYFKREKSKWNLSEIPFIPNVYKYKVKNDPGVKMQLRVIEELIKRDDVDIIINAGDKDSEGYKLVNQVIEYCLIKNKLNKNIKRLWFIDKTEESIRRGIKNLKENLELINYDNEAIARERIEWVIGVNYSRAISLIASSHGNSPIKLLQGCVLGSVVKYIYDRYKDQERFISEKYYNISLLNENTSVILKNSIFKEDEQLKALRILNELNRSNSFISKIEKEQKNKYPHNLFSLTSLQNSLNENYKMTNKSVLSLAQKLYEKGYITYPKTNSEFLMSNSREIVKEIIEKFKPIYKNIEFKDTKRIFDDEKVDSNEAIRPTVKIPTDLNGDEKIVYDAIKNRFLANFCIEECIVEYTTVTVSNSINEYTAQINGNKVIKMGFLNFENIIKNKIIPAFNEGEKVDGTYVIKEYSTQAPKNVSITELNNFLESPLAKENESIEEKYENILAGNEIGTAATRSDIIENAINYNYIDEINGMYKITKKGIYFIETAEKLGLLIGSEHNIRIGRYLKAVFNNKITIDQCLDSIEKFVTNSIAKAKTIKVDSFEREVIGKCIVCKKNVYESQKAYYCEGNKDKSCKFFINKKDRFMVNRGKIVTKQIVKTLLNKGICKVNLNKVDGSGSYSAFIKLVKNDDYYNIKFADKNEIPKNSILKCPRCGKDIYESEKSYYCSSYKDQINKCSYTLWKNNKFLSEKNILLTKENYKSLLEGEKILIKDIKRKDKKGSYNAYLYIEDTGTYVNYKLDIVKRNEF